MNPVFLHLNTSNAPFAAIPKVNHKKYFDLIGLNFENTQYLENSDNGSDADFEPYKSDKSPKESFSCDICSKNFAKKSKLERHMETHGSKKSFSCQG